MKGKKGAKQQAEVPRTLNYGRAEAAHDVVVDAPPPARPFKPRRGLLVGLLIGFVVWVGVLLGLYFKTVYPMRHAESAATTAPTGN